MNAYQIVHLYFRELVHLYGVLKSIISIGYEFYKQFLEVFVGKTWYLFKFLQCLSPSNIDKQKWLTAT